MKVQPENLSQVREKGMEILTRELGPVATIRFLQQFQSGQGDYTKERHQWLDQISIDQIVEQKNMKK